MTIRCVLMTFMIFLAVSTASIEAVDFSLRSKPFDRHSFPDGFVFGAASSAFQYEGATNEYGRRPSIWDTFVRQHPEKVLDGSNADVAEGFYHLFKEDVARMKEVGLDSFRFSISWPRLLPNGKVEGGINQAGIDFYNFLINELISNGIQPFVTLFHWDLPQALEDKYSGFLSPEIVNDYGNYVDLCFKEFGDRVRHWITINEPNIFSTFGYGFGTTAPGRCSRYIGNCTAGDSATEPYVAAHHLLLSHATAVKIYRDKYQDTQRGIIGITLQTFWMVPKYQTIASRLAAVRALDFAFGWFANPITYGRYPRIMRKLVGDRLPRFTEQEAELVKGSFDFLGINYYSARYTDRVEFYSNVHVSHTTDSRVNETAEKNGNPIGEETGASWLYIYPRGIEDLLLYTKRKYKNPTIYITENGLPEVNNKSLPIAEALNDEQRIKYHKLHLSYLLKALKRGVDLRGYYAWSFLDDFEWQFGYTNRYGLVYVDFQDGLKRYFKRSALWLKDFLSKDTHFVS